MPFQILAILNRSFLSWSSVDEEKTTTTEEQSAHLPQTWFSEIPHCTLQCLYVPALECGCAHSDYSCICRSFADIAKREPVKACADSCPHNPDQRWAPGRILDFCQLVGEDIQLPPYMDQYAGLHRRQVYASDGDSNGFTSFPWLESQTDSSGDYSTVAPSATDYTSALASETRGASTIFSTDVVTASRTISGLAGSSATGATSTSTSASAPPTDTSSPSSSAGLSTGVKAGIGVAVPLAVMILLLGLFWYLRKRRANKQSTSTQADTGDNIPELSGQTWPKKSLPAEADGNALNESDSKPVLPSQPILGSSEGGSVVYELSANPSLRSPPPADLASHHRDETPGQQQSFATWSTTSHDISRKAIVSSLSSTGPETASREGVGYLQSNVSSDTSSALAQPCQKAHTENSQTEQATNAELSELVAEMARVTEQRERLENLQLLQEREAELKKQIAALKSAMSRESGAN
ncbi:Hypothetical protein PENO1_061710 [Penicillium occitanis (nom. inval.)]|nr:Hypothetical protein PENO1_061710 [Penicillium occitanis (nom. inval.)]PCG98428.1 hypothetical protein PENOC_063010 [Penicillium occitanis (nom. inval.)]